MIYLDLTFNLTLLVALSILSGFIDKRWTRHTRMGVLLQGVLFGSAAVLGSMLRPLHLEPGLIFDGRSLMVSLCALFFGPWAAALAGTLAILCRIWVGGVGMLTGSLVILSSAGLGLLAHSHFKPKSKPPSARSLYLFGIVVHLAMLVLMFTMPGGIGLSVVLRIGLPVILLYPLATILAGKILSDQVNANQVMAALQEREERYARLFNSSNDGVFIYPLSNGKPGTFAEVNAIACTRLGYCREELLKLSPVDITVEGMEELKDRAIETLLKTGQAIYEMDYVGKSGEKIPMEMSSRVFESGGEQYVLSLAREISERKRAEKVLRESEERLNLALSAAKAGSWEWDVRTNENIWSDELWILFGLVPHSFHSSYESWVQAIHPDNRDLVESITRTAVLNAAELNIEWRVNTPDDSERWLMSRGQPEQDEHGQVVRYRGIVIDISERKLAEEERAKLQDQLNQAQKMESIGVLAGGIAHDFNNILSAIFGYTLMASLNAEPGSELAEDLDRVLASAYRAKDLVKQILAFSRHSTIDRMPMKIQPLVKESLKMLRASIPTTIAIFENIHPQCGVILADPTHIHQIVMNLCTNAFHAMEKRGGVLSVAVNTRSIGCEEPLATGQLCPGEYVELTVSDTGAGIGPEIMDKIFDPYFTTKEIGKGTGMGLSISHGIIESYGGAITVESTLGQGATFHVYFPVVQEEAKGAEELEVAPRGKERILFVEDEEILAKMGKEMLEMIGYTVIAHNRSLEALETFLNQPDQFDIVITDLTMPGMTGIDLAQRILRVRPELPIILCTGYSNVVSEASAKAIGIREFVLKPLAMSSIAQLIRKVIDEGPAISTALSQNPKAIETFLQK